MADLSQEEFLRRIGAAQPLVLPGAGRDEEQEGQSRAFSQLDDGNEAEGALSEGNTRFSLLPASEAALERVAASVASAQGGRAQRVGVGPRDDKDFATRLGARKGVPFDTQTGVPFMKRLRVAAQPTKEEEEKALVAAYGEGKVRRNSFDDLVVTTTDAEGKEVDKLADPIGLDAGDAASVLGQLPEIAGSILGAIRAKGLNFAPGIWNAAKTLAGSVAGAAVAGAVKDVAVRKAEGEAIQPGEIVERRGMQSAIDTGVGAGLGLAGKVVVELFSPFSKTGPIQFKAKEAQRYFANKYGVKLPMTPAEATGSSFLQRAEAMESQKPGASVPFEALWKERERKLGELQQIALGGGVPDEEAAGRRALEALGVKANVLTENVEKAAQEAADLATAELKRGVGAAVDKPVIGESILTGAKAEKAAFDAANEANYDAFYSNPLAKAKVIEGRGLKGAIDRLLGELPSVEQRVAVPTGVVGADGKPVMKMVTQETPVATPVRPRLEELSRKLEDGKVSINDLKQIRTDVDNAIKTGEAVPGVKEGRLKSLYGKLTDAIEQGLGDIGDPALTASWNKAAAFYKGNVRRFEQAGIAELFRDPINALGKHEVVDRAISSPDVYGAYKEFFGDGSPQMMGVRQAIRDYTFGQSDLSPSVGAAAFVRRLEALPREIRDDVFDVNSARLRSSAQALRAAKGDTLPVEEMNALLKSGNASAAKIEELLSRQRGKDAAYRNELVKAAGDGSLKADGIKPTEFVNRMVFNKGTQPEDVREVLALLGDRPDVLEDMRRLTFQRALDDATTVARGTGRKVIDANALAETLGDENTAKRLRTVLGAGTFEDLERVADFLKPGATVQQAAKSAGGLGTGQQIAGLVEKGALKYVDRAIKNFFIATVYTNPAVKALITNTVLEGQGKANVVNYLVASTPFVEAVAKAGLEGGERRAMQEIKGSIDRYVRENAGAGAAQGPAGTNATGDIPWEEFLRRIGGTQSAQQP